MPNKKNPITRRRSLRIKMGGYKVAVLAGGKAPGYGVTSGYGDMLRTDEPYFRGLDPGDCYDAPSMARRIARAIASRFQNATVYTFTLNGTTNRTTAAEFEAFICARLESLAALAAKA